MRFFATLLISIAMYLLVAVDSPQLAARVNGYIAVGVDATFYQKELVIQGIKALDRERLDPLLPMDRSIAWWLLNGPVIEAQLAEDSFVQKASVQSCSRLSWGCFRIEIQERTPAFLADMQQKPWLLADDGSFIAPIVSPALKRALANNPAWNDLKLRIIKGLVSEGASPEAVRARFNYAKNAITVLEERSDHEVEVIDILDNGEIRVKFRNLALMATFDYDERSPEILSEKATKFRRLVEEFGEKRNLLERVDLAFNNVAVVNLSKQTP